MKIPNTPLADLATATLAIAVWTAVAIWNVPFHLVAQDLVPRLAGGSDELPTPASTSFASPPAGDLDQHIAKLIKQLGDDDYFVRRQAQVALEKCSFEAFDALQEATAHEDLEIAYRARYLLRVMRASWAREDDPPEVKKLLSDYTTLDRNTKLSRMRQLAGMPNYRGVPSLCRFVKYETSAELSKYAAIAILEQQIAEGSTPEDLLTLLAKHARNSDRAGSRWLLAIGQFNRNVEAAIKEWTGFVLAEHSMLENAPGQSNHAIVAGLVELLLDRIEASDLADQEPALLAVRRLASLDELYPATLADLLTWLAEHQDVAYVEEMTLKAAFQFQRYPLLLYGVAEGMAKAGARDRAERLAKRAREFNPEKDNRSLSLHYHSARVLQDRGMLEWACQEYRHVAGRGDSLSPNETVARLAISAQFLLGELLHDMGDEKKAAEAFRQLVEAIEKRPPGAVPNPIPLSAARARMSFFLACHYRNQEDMAKQREYLDKALRADPTDADVLIACYQLTDVAEDYGQDIRNLIQKATSALEQQIAENSDDPSPYNQYAWLVANTEGDLDKAMRYSKESLRLRPENGGYLDTMAHVYFAQGDYEMAVETQGKAAKIEPHSRLIKQQLHLFRKKRDESRDKRNQEE